MSDLETAESLVARWQQALPDAAAPCGPDLEYDNDFLALVQAASGKPDSQFGPAEPPNWRTAAKLSAELLDRSRDLRLAVFWLRANVHMLGYAALPLGLNLISGLMENLWDTVHPLPDPDDADPYGRVNAITLLREAEGLLGDLRTARLVEDRAIGQLDVRAVEVSLGLSPARAGEAEVSRDQISMMVKAALEKTPELRAQCNGAAEAARRLVALVGQKLDAMAAPDLRPLVALVDAVAKVLPPEAVAVQEDESEEGEAVGGAGGGGKRGRLSGSINSREDAIRALDMICDYLERAEPANPAPLFLRRAKQLISHNFLQLMKVLAPDALDGVARLVGIDPESVSNPDGT